MWDLNTYPRCKKQVNMFVHEDLVGSIAETKFLQELVCQSHHLVHVDVIVLKVGINIKTCQQHVISGG